MSPSRNAYSSISEELRRVVECTEGEAQRPVSVTTRGRGVGRNSATTVYLAASHTPTREYLWPLDRCQGRREASETNLLDLSRTRRAPLMGRLGSRAILPRSKINLPRRPVFSLDSPSTRVGKARAGIGAVGIRITRGRRFSAVVSVIRSLGTKF